MDHHTRSCRARARRGLRRAALLAAVGAALAGPGLAAQDNKGTEFVLAFGANNTPPNNLTLFITGDVATNGTVEIPGLSFSTPFSVTPGSITSVNVPTSAEVDTSDLVENLGILVTANDEVVVYGLNQLDFTTDAFLGLPTDILDTEYITLGHTSGRPEFLVAGVVDGTTVTITPTQTVGNRQAGVPYQITLDRLQTYQLIGTSELSGTIITSDQPIAVFSGNRCASVGGNCDHLVEQIPPTSTWGVSFLTASLASITVGDFFRVLARDDATEVLLDGVSQGTIDRGQFLERNLASNSVHQITTSRPALVAQFAKGSSGLGPLMMLIPPTEQFLNAYTVTTPASGFASNFVNVVVRDTDTSTCTIDGFAFTAAFTPIGSTGFSAAREMVGLGTHNLACPTPFGAYSYGFASADSYGYPGGLALEAIAVEACRFTPTDSAGTVGSSHTVDAKLTVNVVDPLGGVVVDFSVAGVNAGTPGTCSPNADCSTDANGDVSFTYVGDGGIGVDQISGTFVNSNSEVVGCQPTPSVTQTWSGADCNANAIPDACDVDANAPGCADVPGAGGSFDVDADGLPDECLFVNDLGVAPGFGDGVAAYMGIGSSAHAFLAMQDQGLGIYEVTDRPDGDPAVAPTQIATWAPSPSDCTGFVFDDVAVADHKAFAAGGTCGLAVVDVTIPDAPVERGFFGNPVYAKDVAAYDEGLGVVSLYVADYFSGLWMLTATDGGPGDVAFSGASLVGPGDGLTGAPIAVDVVGGSSSMTVYVATTDGLFVVDPASGNVLGSCSTNPGGLPLADLTRVPQDVAVAGSTAYVPVWVDGLVAVDVADPSSLPANCPAPLVATEQAMYGATVSESGQRLYVAEGQCGFSAWEINGSVNELPLSPIPLDGAFDCTQGPPSDPLDDTVAFTWAVDELGGVVYAATGRLNPREGGLVPVEFDVDQPPSLMQMLAELPETNIRCGLLGIEPFLVWLPLRFLVRRRLRS